MEFRLHGTTLYNSIYRSDDQVIVNTMALKAPVLPLPKVPGGTLVGTYLESYEKVWERASPLSAPGAQTMFERFTDQARNAVVHAQSETVSLKHKHIGSGHFLLGLAQEGNGLSASTLAALGLQYETARAEVAQLGGQPKRFLRPYRKFDRETKKALEGSLAVALRRRHDFIGTEHMLLGLLRDKHNTACQVLQNLGIPPEQVVQHVNRTLDELAKHTQGPDQGREALLRLMGEQ
ncbi:Clp protease N-terminal domain-containing protein [Nocardiopsis alba]|uniref:Clp protease N-terminal domain-containing protein n=1 Tax=Nocardiopsis alba TaxID=53437 RepID=UPI0036B1CA4E